MRLSIVIPVLNDAENLLSLLLELQTLRPCGVEIIVVDGGSNDRSALVAKPLADCVAHCEAGRARQMNLGAREAKGEYILFLHCDSRLPKNLMSLLGEWQSRCVAWGFFRVQLDCPAWSYRVISCAINARSALTGVSTGDQCQFFKADFFAEISGFDDIALMEDVAISKRARGIFSAYRERAVVVTSARRWKKNGCLNTILLMWGLRLAYWLGVSTERLGGIYYPKAKRYER